MRMMRLPGLKAMAHSRDEEDSPLLWAIFIAALVFIVSIFGILTRPLHFLSAVWPANALLLGLFVRKPALASPLGWLGATIGFLVADLLTGSSLLTTVWLTVGNLVSIFTAHRLILRLNEDDRLLRRPSGVLAVFSICFIASVTAALVGCWSEPVLFGRDVLTGWRTWVTAEFVNYMIVLPVVLIAPPLPRLLSRRHSEWLILPHWRDLAPALIVLLLLLAGLVIGGPGAIAFPVPALLWCALRYRPFTTALLTLCFSIWTITAFTAGWLHLPSTEDFSWGIMSLRLGVGLIALAPLTVASAIGVSNDLVQRLARAANHDYLTDALTRSAFTQRGSALLPRLAAERQPAAVLVLDLDHFKTINDQHGHAVGDIALVAFARTVAGSLRGDDLFGRIGGEEFAVILSRTSAADATAIAERLRGEVARTTITPDTDPSPRMTTSIGLVHVPPTSTKSLEVLLAAADQALYEAKIQGRNRVVVGEPG